MADTQVKFSTPPTCDAGYHSQVHQDGEKSKYYWTCDANDAPAFTGTPKAPSSTTTDSYASNGCYFEERARGWKKICNGK